MRAPGRGLVTGVGRADCATKSVDRREHRSRTAARDARRRRPSRPFVHGWRRSRAPPRSARGVAPGRTRRQRLDARWTGLRGDRGSRLVWFFPVGRRGLMFARASLRVAPAVPALTVAGLEVGRLLLAADLRAFFRSGRAAGCRAATVASWPPLGPRRSGARCRSAPRRPARARGGERAATGARNSSRTSCSSSAGGKLTGRVYDAACCPAGQTTLLGPAMDPVRVVVVPLPMGYGSQDEEVESGSGRGRSAAPVRPSGIHSPRPRSIPCTSPAAERECAAAVAAVTLFGIVAGPAASGLTEGDVVRRQLGPVSAFRDRCGRRHV